MNFGLEEESRQKEKEYIKSLNLSEEQLRVFYDAMCSLQKLNKEINL